MSSSHGAGEPAAAAAGGAAVSVGHEVPPRGVFSSLRSPSALTFIIYNSGNSTTPVRRALKARGWTALEKEEVRKEQKWTANFIWKPTWGGPKPCTPTMARGHVNVAKRQMYNHLKAVEPLCAKDTLFQTVRK